MPTVLADGRVARRAVAACFFVSGAAALVFEVVWLRLLGIEFGHTTQAVTAVLATMMAGLAIGARVLGSRSDALARPLRTYAAVELTIAGWGLATPWLAKHAGQRYAAVCQAWAPAAPSRALLQLAAAAVILLPPAILMGWTLPLLSRRSAQCSPESGHQVGVLYAVNAVGAVAGAAVAGFVLLPGLGVAGASWVAAGLQGVAAAVAIAFDRLIGAPPLVSEPSVRHGLPPRAVTTRATAAASWAAVVVCGASAMAYEIAWTRALAPVLGSSTYAFSSMLVASVGGLAAGAALAARMLRSGYATSLALGVAVVGAGLAALVAAPGFTFLPVASIAAMERLGTSHGAAVAVQLGGSVLLMSGPALLSGMALPLFIGAVQDTPARLGRSVGHAYAANTCGTIAGAVGAGLLLVPWIGTQQTIVVSALASVAVGSAVLLASSRGRGAGGVVPAVAVPVAIALACAPGWDRRLMASAPVVYASDFVAAKRAGRSVGDHVRHGTVLYFREGPNSTVLVYRADRNMFFSVNGKIDGGNTDEDMRTQLLLGHLPALVHPAPRRAFVIGLGTGITAGALATHALAEIDVAEIEPAVVEAAALFRADNHGALEDPRVRISIEDGRSLLASAREPYDIITSEPSNPWMAGIGSLFTREFYELARSHLGPGGVMVQWLHVYALSTDDLRMVMRTFQAVFPSATLWRGTRGDLFLMATDGPFQPDWSDVSRRIHVSSAVRADLERALVDPFALQWQFLLDAASLRAFAGDGPLHTDDRPRLEFSAPRTLYTATLDQNLAALYAARKTGWLTQTAGDGSLNAEQRVRLARTFIQQDAPEDAAEQIERVGDLERLATPLRIERARILTAMGRAVDALADLSALRETAPDDADIGALLAGAKRALDGGGDAQSAAPAPGP